MLSILLYLLLFFLVLYYGYWCSGDDDPLCVPATVAIHEIKIYLCSSKPKTHKKMSRAVRGAYGNWESGLHCLTSCLPYSPFTLPYIPIGVIMSMGSEEDIFLFLTSKAQTDTEGIWLRVMFILWGAVTRIFGLGSNSEKSSSKGPWLWEQQMAWYWSVQCLVIMVVDLIVFQKGKAVKVFQMNQRSETIII